MMIPIDEVVHFDICTHNPETAEASDADSTPTFSVFEESTDTPIISTQSFTKRTGLTGNYRGSFTASAANGFEAGKWYNVIAIAIVGGVTGKKNCLTFRIAPAEATVGVPLVDVSNLNPVADAVMKRDWTAITGESSRSLLNFARFGRNKSSISGSTLTVYKEDGVTVACQYTVTFDANGNITSMTPI